VVKAYMETGSAPKHVYVLVSDVANHDNVETRHVF